MFNFLLMKPQRAELETLLQRIKDDRGDLTATSLDEIAARVRSCKDSTSKAVTANRWLTGLLIIAILGSAFAGAPLMAANILHVSFGWVLAYSIAAGSGVRAVQLCEKAEQQLTDLLARLEQELAPLSENGAACLEALELVENLPAVAELRTRIVERGEHLRVFHLNCMRGLSYEHQAAARDEIHRSACQQLHGLTPATSGA